MQAGISPGCTAVPGRRWKVITSELSALQRVINALILTDRYASALGTESKSVFCTSKRLSVDARFLSGWFLENRG